jgi:hypothetical protein
VVAVAGDILDGTLEQMAADLKGHYPDHPEDMAVVMRGMMTAEQRRRASPLRVLDGGQLLRRDAVDRLHQFQAEHPEVRFTAPHLGGHGRHIAVVPPGSAPGEAREVTVSSLDLAGLMDRLDEIYPPGG